MSTEVSVDVTSDLLDILNAGLATATEPVPYGGLPEGEFIADFQGPQLGRTDKQNLPFIALPFTVTGPVEELVGADVAIKFFLNRESSFDQLLKTVRRMGIKGNKADVIVAALNEKTGTSWRLKVKNREGYSNIYMNGPAN